MQSLVQQVDTIKKKFQEMNLPGLDIMLQMAPNGRKTAIHSNIEYTAASVMLLLYPKNGELYFPLIIRTSNNHLDKHRGQIGLPGGKMESSDENHWTCALRETSEEIGIDQSKIEFIGQLTKNDIPVSAFSVRPFIGYLNAKPKFILQVEEVADIIEVRLKSILDPQIKKTGPVVLSNGLILEDVPYFEILSQKVWGATAMILNEFITLIESESKNVENL